MSAEHRKPVMAFVVLALVAAGVVGIQRADAQGGRLLAAVVGVSAQAHGTLPLSGQDAARAAREQAAVMGPMFAAVLASERSAATEPSPTGPVRPAGESESSVATLPLVVAAAQIPARSRAQAASTTAHADGRSSDPATQRAAARRGGPVDATRDAAADEQRAEKAAQRLEHAQQRAERHAEKRAEKRAKQLARAQHQAEKRAERIERARHRVEQRAQRATERATMRAWHLQRRVDKAAQRGGHHPKSGGHGSRGHGRGHSHGARR